MSLTRLAEIKSQLSELQKEADEIIKSERIAVIKEIQDKMNNFDITIEELQRKAKTAKPASSKSPAVIKYRKSEHEYWVGRGPKPGWVKEVENRGESIEQYRVPV